MVAYWWSAKMEVIMNSLAMWVEDAVGDRYCVTFAKNREGQEASFRKHARWWMKIGYKSNPIGRQPAFPCKIVVEPYMDKSSD